MLKPKRVKHIFQFFDIDGDGFISMKEMNDAFVKEDIKIEDDELEQIYNQHDVDGDGKIDIKEFKDMLRS